MPTLTSSPSSGDQPHARRDIAESFGTDAERYDRARPRYPDALIERIALAGVRVLDVGCGTGIAARQFQAVGCAVLGVEPDARMADLARRHGVETDVSTFEEWEPEGREFDAVVAGTAWHWVDPVAGAEKAARVLRGGGLLVPFWNVALIPSDLAEVIASACERALPEVPFDFRAAMSQQAAEPYQPLLDKAADGMRAAGGRFGAPEQWRYDWEFTYTRDAWLDVMPTQGAFTRFPAERLAPVLEAVGAAIDVRGGAFSMPYATMAVSVRRSRRR
jgi:SAM-dependent methyltransferase